MSTPIRRLLQKNVISPLSPLSPLSSLSPICAHSENITNLNRSTSLQRDVKASGVAKSLNFQVPSKSLVVNSQSPQFRTTRFIKDLQQNKHFCSRNNEIADYNKEALLINTPNKNGLLEKGLTSTANLKILGKGSFGIVVRGVYKDSEVAAKIVKANRTGLPFREINALNLNHENVVKVIDIIHAHSKNHGIVIMEYIRSSRPLQNILDDQKVFLNHNDIVKYSLDVCKGLQYCHGKGVLHMDLKPSNILVCEGSVCKLCDFGNSVKMDEVVQADVCQGTVAYLAPEVLLGRSPTPKCDVYSLGILLWQMKYREMPYSDLEGREVVIYKVVKSGYRPGTLPVPIEDEYYSIYSTCWASDPTKRPCITEIIGMLNTLT